MTSHMINMQTVTYTQMVDKHSMLQMQRLLKRSIL